MDKLGVIDAVHGLAVAFLLWLSRTVYGNRQELTDFKLTVSSAYVTKADQEKTNDKLFEKLDKILDKMDTKQDKK